MKESDFYEWLETQPVEDKIVSIKYKYSHEKEWTQSNEILEVDLSYEDVYVWLDDWDEGQQDIEILGCISVSDINVPIFDRKTENSSEKPNNSTISKMEQVDEPQYDIDKGTIKCDNCSENGSYKCTKCDGEMYFKRLEPKDEPQTERSE